MAGREATARSCFAAGDQPPNRLSSIPRARILRYSVERAMPSRAAAASLLPSASASACRIVSRSARSSEASRCRVGDERYSGGRCAWVKAWRRRAPGALLDDHRGDVGYVLDPEPQRRHRERGREVIEEPGRRAVSAPFPGGGDEPGAADAGIEAGEHLRARSGWQIVQMP